MLPLVVITLHCRKLKWTQSLFQLTCDHGGCDCRHSRRVSCLISSVLVHFEIIAYMESSSLKTKEWACLQWKFSLIISNHTLPKICHCFKLWLFGVLMFFCQCENWLSGIVYCCFFTTFSPSTKRIFLFCRNNGSLKLYNIFMSEKLKL